MASLVPSAETNDKRRLVTKAKVADDLALAFVTKSAAYDGV
jgi:hypothetical protein